MAAEDERPETLGGFWNLGTSETDLGPCTCPGTPHDRDVAIQYDILGWDDLEDVQMQRTEGAARRVIVVRSIASWNLLMADKDGKTVPVPIVDSTVRLIADKARRDALWDRAYRAFVRAGAPLPNGSSAG